MLPYQVNTIARKGKRYKYEPALGVLYQSSQPDG